jgi:putative endonuclease
MDAREFGASGEDAAEKHLKTLGYKILERNYRTKMGELDIVASDGDTIVFVEVKSRRDKRFGEPELAVDARKQRQLSRAAFMYLTRAKKYNSPCRFDVVSIFSMPGEGLKVSVLKDAFELSEGY